MVFQNTSYSSYINKLSLQDLSSKFLTAVWHPCFISIASRAQHLNFNRQNLGRPGIPGSKDLDTALKRLSLRRQNEREEENRLKFDQGLDKELVDLDANIDRRSETQEMYV